jgi:hypothetical protein
LPSHGELANALRTAYEYAIAIGSDLETPGSARLPWLDHAHDLSDMIERLPDRTVRRLDMSPFPANKHLGQAQPQIVPRKQHQAKPPSPGPAKLTVQERANQFAEWARAWEAKRPGARHVPAAPPLDQPKPPMPAPRARSCWPMPVPEVKPVRSVFPPFRAPR